MAPTSTLTRLGATVRRLRKHEGMTQQNLAEAADMAVESVSRLESGQLNISVRKLDRVAVALGATIPALFDGASTPKAKPGRPEERRIMRLLAGLDDAQLKKVDAGLMSFLGLLSRPAKKPPVRKPSEKGRTRKR